MLRKAGIVAVSATLGLSSGAAVAGCGEHRGSVKIKGATGGEEGATTGATGTAGTATVRTQGTATAP